MTQCEKKPRVNEIEEEVQQYVAGKVDVCTFVLICTHVCRFVHNLCVFVLSIARRPMHTRT